MNRSIGRFVSRLAVAAMAVTLGACVVYDPYYPYGYPPPNAGPSAYDRSWNAAVGSMRDQGVEITRHDSAAGLIEGRRGGITVTTRVATQADGRVRVETNTGGNLSEDPGLSERLSRSYDARMGR